MRDNPLSIHHVMVLTKLHGSKYGKFLGNILEYHEWIMGMHRCKTSQNESQFREDISHIRDCSFVISLFG